MKRSVLRVGLLAFVLLAASSALGASRARYGGAATFAVLRKPSRDPLLADTPSEAALSRLTAAGLCRLTSTGTTPVLARRFVRASPTELEVGLWADLHAANGSPITALDVAAAWRRLFAAATSSPYRALLFPIQGGERGLSAAVRGRATLELHTTFPWPDLERSLCHPALAITVPSGFGRRSPVGPYARGKSGLRAQDRFPLGRPFLDRIRIRAMDARSAERSFALGRVQGVLGGKAARKGPMLFATYLLFQPERVGKGLRATLERAIDRDALVRYFVPQPAAVLRALLPPGDLAASSPTVQPEPGEGSADAGARAPPSASAAHGDASHSGPSTPPPRTDALLYDESRPSQRAVAERIALVLQQQGLAVRLRGVDRATLNQRWAKGDFDLMLRSVLLPPDGAPALALALTLGGRADLLGKELPPLGAIADPAARDAAARKRAATLRSATDAFPLFVQGARLEVSPTLEGVGIGPDGIPTLVDASLAPDLEGAAPSRNAPRAR